MILNPMGFRFHLQVKAVVALTFLLLLPSSGQSQTPNPVLSALPDGQWSALPNTAMTKAGDMAIECCDFSIGCELPGIFSFSGATLDTDRQRIVIGGGGHNDYFGNQLVAFDIATLQWQLITPPTSVCLFSDPPDYRFTDGSPVARHTYDHMGYLEHLGLFFAYSGATADSPPFNGGDSYGDLWTFDFDTGLWTDRTALQSGDIDFGLTQPGASGEYDPVSQLWFQVSEQGVWRIDLADHVWEKINEDGHPGIERVSVLDSKRRQLWSYGGDYGGEDNLTSYDIATNQLNLVSAENLPGITSGAGLTYDSANDQLALFGGYGDDQLRSVFNYDIDSQTWTEFPYTGGPSGAERTYSRFLYDSINNVFFLIENIDHVWVWKNTLGNSPEIFRDGFESGDTTAWSTTVP